MTHSNSAGKNAIRLNIVRADQDPTQLLDHNRSPWPNNYFSLVWTDTDQACLYVHDEAKPGGYRIACTGDTEPYSVIDFVLVDNQLILSDSEGMQWTVDLSAYLADTYVDSFTVDGENLVIGRNNGLPDLEVSLTSVLAPYIGTVVESPAGRFSFYRGGTLIERWWQGGFTDRDVDGNVTITNPDGTTVLIPFQELTSYGIQFTAQGKVQFLVGGVVTHEWQQGAQVDQLADGQYRATNFAGNVVTWYGLKDATLASIDEAAGTVTIQNPDGSTVTFGVGNSDAQLMDAEEADGILTITKVDETEVEHRQTRVTQTGAQDNLFTANHRGTWPNIAWRMPYVTRPSAEVAVLNVYNHDAAEWEEVPVITQEDVVILNNPTIYIRESGSANPPITEQADLTVGNAFNSFTAVRNFMVNTLVVGTVTLNVRGDYTSLGDIGPAEFKNAQTIIIEGDPADPTNFTFQAGFAGSGRGCTITGGTVTVRDFTVEFVDLCERPGVATPFFVEGGSLSLQGAYRFQGAYDRDRVSAADAYMIGNVGAGAALNLGNDSEITYAVDVGTKMEAAIIVTNGGIVTVGRDITVELQRTPDFANAFIDLQSGSGMRSVLTVGNSPVYTGAGRGIAPYTIAVRPLAIARIGGSYGNSAAVKVYDWGVDVTAGGAQANMLIDAIGVLNNVAGP